MRGVSNKHCLLTFFICPDNVVCLLSLAHIWASSRENLSSGVCEQHRCRLACESTQSDQPLCKLSTDEISIFSVAEETGLKLTLSETPKKGFLATRPIFKLTSD